jgi:hypothetical protein
VTTWLAGQNAGTRNGERAWAGLGQGLDLGAYRSAVARLAAEIRDAGDTAARAERIVPMRLRQEEFALLLNATPHGRAGTVARLLFDLRSWRPLPGRSARGAAALVQIALLAQIDALWWGRAPAFFADADVLNSPDLVDLDALRQAGYLGFRYRRQASNLLSRAARCAERAALPARAPRTAGLWLARTRPQMVGWLNRLAADFAALAPPGTPPLWVTSLARSVQHQLRLQSLGYAALLPSSHCTGHAADIEIAWYQRYGAHRVLGGLLLERQRQDEINVIDEGQTWHICLHPRVAGRPRRLAQAVAWA